jgi:hypothetical protein
MREEEEERWEKSSQALWIVIFLPLEICLSFA